MQGKQALFINKRRHVLKNDRVQSILQEVQKRTHLIAKSSLYEKKAKTPEPTLAAFELRLGALTRRSMSPRFILGHLQRHETMAM
jgi:hypothetical protein